MNQKINDSDSTALIISPPGAGGWSSAEALWSALQTGAAFCSLGFRLKQNTFSEGDQSVPFPMAENHFQQK